MLLHVCWMCDETFVITLENDNMLTMSLLFDNLPPKNV